MGSSEETVSRYYSARLYAECAHRYLPELASYFIPIRHHALQNIIRSALSCAESSLVVGGQMAIYACLTPYQSSIMYNETASMHQCVGTSSLRHSSNRVDVRVPLTGSESIPYTSSHVQKVDYNLSCLSSAISRCQSMPTYLNQLGLQSSLNRNLSPSVKRPVTHPLHLGDLGQLK